MSDPELKESGCEKGCAGDDGESPAMSFEEALGRLEEIARSLESLELGLDESLRLFQEGVRLARVCSSKLDEAEHRIEQLLEAPGGSAVVAPLEGLHK